MKAIKLTGSVIATSMLNVNNHLCSLHLKLALGYQSTSFQGEIVYQHTCSIEALGQR